MERRRKVLVLWHEGCTPATLQPVLTRIREEWAERQGEAEVMLEHVDRLKSAEYSVSTFDHALLGSIPPAVYVHDSDLLEEVSRILKPSAGISIREPVVREGSSIPSSSLRTLSQLTMSLRLAGLVEPLKVADENPLEETGLVDELNKFGIDSNNITIVTVQAKKPSYQLGASAPISLGRISTVPSQQAPLSRNAESAKIWTLAANDMLDDDVDLMDSDTLLSEEDLMRPDPASLKSACGPSSGKRKACKNCSCGLADELLNDPSKPAVKRTVTSSCGSCYLGDAFRCASCPYLGMPAFKPGQEIKLSDRQLNADQ